MSNDRLADSAERFAKLFGSPKFIIGQTLVVILWITLNITALVSHWDPYPFILLNLMFSTQASYAAPLILLAEHRQQQREQAKEQQHEALLLEIAAVAEKLEDHFRL